MPLKKSQLYSSLWQSCKEIGDRINKIIGRLAEANELKGVIDQADFNDESKGQFYTPAEVSRIMAKVVGIGPDTRQDQTIYDPTCGSGSLLLKAADEAPRAIDRSLAVRNWLFGWYIVDV